MQINMHFREEVRMFAVRMRKI